MLVMTAREVIKKLTADGWVEVRHTGGHKQFSHPSKPGLVTVPVHPGDIKIGTLKSIERQSGVSLR